MASDENALLLRFLQIRLSRSKTNQGAAQPSWHRRVSRTDRPSMKCQGFGWGLCNAADNFTCFFLRAMISSDGIAAAMEASSELPTPRLKWYGHRKINLRKAAICLLLSSVNRVLSRPSKKPISEHPIQSHFLCCIAGPPFLVRAPGPAGPGR